LSDIKFHCLVPYEVGVTLHRDEATSNFSSQDISADPLITVFTEHDWAVLYTKNTDIVCPLYTPIQQIYHNYTVKLTYKCYTDLVSDKL